MVVENPGIGEAISEERLHVSEVEPPRTVVEAVMRVAVAGHAGMQQAEAVIGVGPGELDLDELFQAAVAGGRGDAVRKGKARAVAGHIPAELHPLAVRAQLACGTACRVEAELPRPARWVAGDDRRDDAQHAAD